MEDPTERHQNHHLRAQSNAQQNGIYLWFSEHTHETKHIIEGRNFLEVPCFPIKSVLKLFPKDQMDFQLEIDLNPKSFTL